RRLVPAPATSPSDGTGPGKARQDEAASDAAGGRPPTWRGAHHHGEDVVVRCTPIFASGAERATVDDLHPAPIWNPGWRRTGVPAAWHAPSFHGPLSHKHRTNLFRVVGGEALDPKLPGPSVLKSQGVGLSRHQVLIRFDKKIACPPRDWVSPRRTEV